ncbi:MAG: multiheme c-type cytochrome [Gemmataceae bacterium]
MTYRVIIPVSLAFTTAIAVGMTAYAGTEDKAYTGSDDRAISGPQKNQFVDFDLGKFRGSPVASCSSAGCHGGGNPGTKGSEQSTWASGDPHAKAYRVLFNEDSLRISANLRKSDPKRPLAHRDASCLACHASPHDATFDGSAIAHSSDGVGCDACHGPSSQWLTRHYESDWKTLGLTQKELLGFRNTKNLVTRLGTCVGCHVGDANREVTHDLIAAGHPRLAFEATRYHFSAKYKKHWTETVSPREFEIRTWAIGQVLAAGAVVELVRHRAEQIKFKMVPWPELAEQGCFACHQGLTHETKSQSNRRLGTADWQPWYLATLDLVAARSPQLFPGTTSPDLTSINELVAEMRKARPDPEVVRVRALAAQKTMDAWIETIRAAEKEFATMPVSDDTLRSLAEAIAKRGESLGDWDRVAPHYLALAAFYHADSSRFAPWKSTLLQLKSIVNYPRGFNSPKEFDAGKSRELFQDISKGIGR